jgi:hypothetical protein
MTLRALTFAAVLLFAPPATAQTDRDAFCAAIGALANSIMLARQSGTPLTEAMQIAAHAGGIAGPTRQMVIMAWDQPRYQNPAVQQRAIEDFRDKFVLSCYKNH